MCANCALIQGKDGDEWRPCAIFPDKLVNANGWCSAYAPKPA
ncbi:high-potential iron-sulfur protein [Photobacterium damselae subsp. piscicida]|nr:high-potential iron-sulfur protein [Photobacterium damselae subsp. piscicida]